MCSKLFLICLDVIVKGCLVILRGLYVIRIGLLCDMLLSCFWDVRKVGLVVMVLRFFMIVLLNMLFIDMLLINVVVLVSLLIEMVLMWVCMVVNGVGMVFRFWYLVCWLV